MRILPFVALSACLLLGAGCFKKAEPVVLPDQPERSSENMVGDVMVKTVDLERNFVLNEFASCEFTISYPTIESGLPVNVQGEIDTKIAQFIAEALGSADEVTSTAALDKLADTALAQCQTEITQEYNDLSSAGEELFTNLKRNVEIVYNVKLNQYHLLALGLDEYSYTGGAHPNQLSMFMNVDRGGDRLLTLGDLLKPEYLRTFLQYEKAKLLADNRDNLYPESADEFDTLIEDRSPAPAEAQLTAYGDIDNFYLTPTSIVTYYNTYDIAPYAAGPVFVEIPYTEIKEYISLNGPLVPVVEKL